MIGEKIKGQRKGCIHLWPWSGMCGRLYQRKCSSVLKVYFLDLMVTFIYYIEKIC